MDNRQHNNQENISMGGNQSKLGQPIPDMPKINHPRFQNIKLIQNKFDEVGIEVKIPVASINEYNQWVSNLKDAPTDSENFLLPISHQFQKEGFCGSSGFATVYFPNFPYVLADEIRNRASLKQKYFDEPELWYLIYTLISAGHQFHKSGMKIGDVRPENVFINEDGQVKVATRLTWPSESTNYHKTFFEKENTYLSPEELKDIHFAKMEPSCDLKSAESFSIGLTCLDAGTLDSSASLYLSGKFDYNGLSARLQELHDTGYSQILCMVVSNLCEPDSDRRSSCSELYKWLQPFEESIINLESFQVSSLPQKFTQLGLHQQYDASASQNIPHQPQNQSHLQSNPVSGSTQNSGYHGSSNTSGSISSSQVQPNLPSQFGAPRSNYYQSVPPPQQFIKPQHPVIPVQQSADNVINVPYPPQNYTIPHPSIATSQKPAPMINSQPPSGQVFYQQGQVLQKQVIQQQGQVIQQQGQVIQQQGQVIQQQGQVPQQPVQVSTSQMSQMNENRVPQAASYYYPPQYVQSQYTQNVQYSKQAGEQKSSMDMTLEKIDEQLQLSRKMFPS